MDSDHRIDCTTCINRFHVRCLDKNSAKSNNLVCPECKCKKPKTGDNSNTPVKGSCSVPQSQTVIDTLPTVMTRKQKQAKTLPAEKQATGLTLESIKSIIAEEFSKSESSMSLVFKDIIKTSVSEELKSLRNEISGMDKSLSFISEMYEETKSKLAEQEINIKHLKDENSTLRETIQNLSSRMQLMEQYSRASNIEVQCLPEHKNENVGNIVLQIGKVINFPLQEGDIHQCTRVAKLNASSDRARSIVVKFASPRIRDGFLAQSIKFNRSNKTNKLNTSHVGMAGNQTPIFIVEHLSPIGKALHAAARRKAKELGYKFVWTRQGKIYMRKNETSEYVYVKDSFVLDKLS